VKPPIPVPPAEVASLRARLGLPPGARILLTIGRLSREKGHRDLVRAIHVLRALRQELEFRLVIVGDGPERAGIRTLTSALGLEGEVLLAGHQSNVQPFYALADLFVLPSRSEGSPNVLLEAMAAGVPVVSTGVGGVPEIVRHGESALLVKAGDTRAMAEAILRLLQDSGLARSLAQAASQAVSRNHTPEGYLRALVELYQEVLGTPSSPAPSRL
jgi:glycosyltransferase involved in cell wall biosynthesis